MNKKKYNLSKNIKSKNYLLKEKEKERKSNSQSPPKNNIKIHNKIKEKKLLINLDDTLIHYSDNMNYYSDLTISQEIINENNQKIKKKIYINFHPGSIPFIEEISYYYEILIFTNLTSSIAEPILNSIDPNNRIDYKFYLDNCNLVSEKKIMKNLNHFGEEKNIILLDNSYPPIYNESNRIPIKNWIDDCNDLELYKLIPILKNLNGFYDVKTEIYQFVQNNTFIWGKAINWIKENLLNTTYLNDVENVLKMEKTNFDIQVSSQRNRENNENKIFNTCNTISDIYEELNKSINFNLFDKNVNDIKDIDKINKKNNNLHEKKNNNDFIKITNNFIYNNDLNSKNGNDDNNDFDKDYCFNRLVTEEDKSYKKQINKFINNQNEKNNFRNEKKDNFRRCNSMTKKKFHLIKKPILSSLKGIIMKKNIQDNKNFNTSQDNVLFLKLKNQKNIKQNIKNSKIHLSQDKIQKNNPYKFITKIQNKNTNKHFNSNVVFKKRGNHFSSYSINLNNNSQC